LLLIPGPVSDISALCEQNIGPLYVIQVLNIEELHTWGTSEYYVGLKIANKNRIKTQEFYDNSLTFRTPKILLTSRVIRFCLEERWTRLRSG
jgi:hypothetical protein